MDTRILNYPGRIKTSEKLQTQMEPGEYFLPCSRAALIVYRCNFLHGFDIVVTTYRTLQKELGVAKVPIIRPKRQAASYFHVEKPRSPLVKVEWARVFMDEVQLVGGGKTG